MTDTIKSGPDIFIAATRDDPAELARAIHAGQTLNDIEPTMYSTPLHVACMNGSVNFLEAAKQYDFDPWRQDKAGCLAIDHAAARGLTEVHKMLLRKMYSLDHGHTRYRPRT